MLFTEECVLTLGKDLVADTTSETTTAVEDMSDYDEITWLIGMGDVDAAAVMTFTPKENTANSVSSPTPTAITVAAVSAGVITSGAAVITEASGSLDDKVIAVTVQRAALTKRYVFLSITVTVESYEIDKIITVKRKARKEPVTQSADVALVAKCYA